LIVFPRKEFEFKVKPKYSVHKNKTLVDSVVNRIMLDRVAIYPAYDFGIKNGSSPIITTSTLLARIQLKTNEHA
jgi:hypothetical protein